MRNYEERAKDFIKAIYPLIFDFHDLEDVMESVEEFNYDHNRNVKVSHGCARVAFITSDYVVKYTYDPEEEEFLGGGEEEVELYAKAERDGYAHLFAKVTRFDYNDIHFYIMPRIRGISESRNWKWRAYHFMTEDEKKWCAKHKLTDLHCNNYGFRNGRVCIIDYACRGYCSLSTESWS